MYPYGFLKKVFRVNCLISELQISLKNNLNIVLNYINIHSTEFCRSYEL